MTPRVSADRNRGTRVCDDEPERLSPWRLVRPAEVRQVIREHEDARFTACPEYQAAIRSRVTDGKVSRSEAEKEVLGTDHAEVGA